MYKYVAMLFCFMLVGAGNDPVDKNRVENYQLSVLKGIKTLQVGIVVDNNDDFDIYTNEQLRAVVEADLKKAGISVAPKKAGATNEEPLLVVAVSAWPSGINKDFAGWRVILQLKEPVSAKRCPDVYMVTATWESDEGGFAPVAEIKLLNKVARVSVAGFTSLWAKANPDLAK